MEKIHSKDIKITFTGVETFSDGNTGNSNSLVDCLAGASGPRRHAYWSHGSGDCRSWKKHSRIWDTDAAFGLNV